MFLTAAVLGGGHGLDLDGDVEVGQGGEERGGGSNASAGARAPLALVVGIGAEHRAVGEAGGGQAVDVLAANGSPANSGLAGALWQLIVKSAFARASRSAPSAAAAPRAPTSPCAGASKSPDRAGGTRPRRRRHQPRRHDDPVEQRAEPRRLDALAWDRDLLAGGVAQHPPSADRPGKVPAPTVGAARRGRRPTAGPDHVTAPHDLQPLVRSPGRQAQTHERTRRR